MVADDGSGRPGSGGGDDLPTGLRKVYEEVTTYSEGTPAEFAEEVRELENLLKRDPGNKDIMEWLAFKYYSANDFERARQLYLDLIDAEHRVAHQHFYLGNTYYKMNRLPEAMRAWEKTVQIDPNDSKAKKARARIEKVRKELGELI